MTRFDLLRRVDLHAYAVQQRVRHWRQLRYPVACSRPAPEGVYLSFQAQGAQGIWTGLIDARQWLAHTLAQLDDLLPAGCPDSDIARLFEVADYPLTLAPAELRYDSISQVQLIEGSCLSNQSLMCLDTPQGTVWFLSDPPLAPPAGGLAAWLNPLKLPMSLVLGTGLFSPAQLMRLAPGDVLLITDLAQYIWLAGGRRGHFSLNEEGIRMEINPSSTDPLEQQTPEKDVALDSLASLPVRLEFVLQDITCDLTQISAFMQGQILPLTGQAHRNIEIRVHGQTIATGELVQWDEGLGVELHKVHRGPSQ